MDWLILAGFLFGIVILWYALKSKTIAWQPSQRGLFIGTGLALVAVSLWMTLPGLGSGLDSKDVLSVLFIFLSLILYGSMASFLYIKKHAGTVLFDVPRSRSRRISGLITAAMFAILIAVTLLTVNISSAVLIEIAFYLSVVIYFISPYFGKVELREQGIVETYTLYRWSNISSYQWVGQNESNLMMVLKAPWRKTSIITLPPDHKGSIDSVLRERIGRSV